jgi:hypothetical protein
MSRKRTHRKVWPLSNPIALAIDGARITDDVRLDQLCLLELSAIESFKTGTATQDDWRAMADLVNLSETMCGMGIGKAEVLPTAQLVEQALGEAQVRFQTTGRIGTTGPGLQAMRDLQEWHHVQRTSVARSVYEQAIVQTRNRIRSAHPSVKVYVAERAAA